MISKKSDTAPYVPESHLDIAIREWIIPALAKHFLQLRRKEIELLLVHKATPEESARDRGSEEIDYAALGRTQSTKEHV